jgi:hypothetical protein
MEFGEVLRRSWEITWKHKALWVLGILASCSGGGGGNGGGGGQLGGARGYLFGEGDFPALDRFFENLSPEALTALALGAACVLVLIGLAALVLGVLGQSGLIAAFDLADAGHPVTLGEAFRRGLQFFWRVLGIQFIIGVLVFITAIVLAVGGVVVTAGTFGFGLICLIPLLCLLIPVMFMVGVYTMLAQVTVVVEDLGMMAALQRSWTVLKTHLGPIAIMALILVLGSAVVGLLFALPLIVIALPALAGALLGGEGQASTGLVLSTACFGGFVPVLIVLNGILQTFVAGAWTITYRRLTGSPAVEERTPLPEPA